MNALPIQSPEVKERIDPRDNGQQPKNPNKIFTFPEGWGFQKCWDYCKSQNYNVFIFGTVDGIYEFTGAFSWKLSFYHIFGYWPKG